MNKLIILTFALLSLTVIYADQCYRCVTPNTIIPTNTYGEYVKCINENTQTYNNGSYNCAYLPTLGEACDGLCNFGYSCNYSICAALNYIDIGGKCKSNDQCINSNCVEGVCELSEYCNNDNECPWNKYCEGNTEKCVTKKVAGDGCDCSSECANGLYCDGERDECTKAFSLQEGDACDTGDAELSCDISKQLYCVYDGSNSICVKLTPTASSVQCNGTDNEICRVNEYCDCASNSCKPLYTLSANAEEIYNDYYTCLTKNKCSTESSLVPESCMVSKCGREMCATNLVQSGSQCTDPNFIPLCKKLLAETDSSSVSSSNVVKISFVLLILSVILSIYF